ncbi:hypothetical protein AOQ84DRAFT_262071, partial [Glonium stellatum]
MAFRQHHRPQPSRQISFQTPEPLAELDITSPQRKRPLEDSEEWVLFSPTAATSTTRTHTTSTERTTRTAGLSRFSDFGSLETAARSDRDDDDDLTCQGTDLEDEGELDSLDDGLHAFHEPSEYSAPSRAIEESGETVLPTHDGLGTFPASSSMVQDQLWQFERQSPRRRQRRRSSVQRRLDALEEAEEVNEEDIRRQRIEKWRIEQSRALLEEIEKETRRRRRMSLVSAAKSRTDSVYQEDQTASHAGTAVSDLSSRDPEGPSDDNAENLSFWQRFTRRVIRDLMGIDENLLSVIFGEALPEIPQAALLELDLKVLPETILNDIDGSAFRGEPWQHKILERVARELGILVHQLSEHPGAFSTYLQTQEAPAYAGLSSVAEPPIAAATEPSLLTTSQYSLPSPTAAVFAPTLQNQPSATTYSEASLWGIEEEPELDPLNSFRQNQQPPNSAAKELLRNQHEREYWERELDVKMVFNFLVKRFSSRPPTPAVESSNREPSAPSPLDTQPANRTGSEVFSARRAALIRQHHPLVSRNADRMASSSGISNRRRDLLHRHHYHHTHQTFTPTLRNPVLHTRTASSSCASQSTKKSKRSTGSGRNYWDMASSVGSGSV